MNQTQVTEVNHKSPWSKDAKTISSISESTERQGAGFTKQRNILYLTLFTPVPQL